MMRVVGGEFRSRKLKAVEGRAVRPTSDRLRETLFNVLGDKVVGKVFVDAYAGSGAVGIEALSRGAARAIFIEKNRRAASVVAENLRTLGLAARARIVTQPAAAALRSLEPDIVFLDPPYGEAPEYAAALQVLGEKPPELVVAEHATRTDLEPAYGGLKRVRKLRQGDSTLSFYRRVAGALACWLVAVSLLWSQALDWEKAAIGRAQRTPVARLDAVLPQQPFAEWFSRLVGKAAKIEWELNDCGEQTGNPATDAGRDFPACAAATATLPDGREITVHIAVGTLKKGISRPPAVYGIFLLDKGRSLLVKRLRELPAALRRPP